MKRTRLSVTSITSASIAGRSSSDGSASSARASRSIAQSPARAAKPSVERCRRQERKPARNELLQRRRDREWLAGRDRNAAPVERPPELEREERIPARRVDDLEQRRPVRAGRGARGAAPARRSSSPPSWTRVRRSPSNAGPQASERSPHPLAPRRGPPRSHCAADGTRTRARHATTYQASGHRRARRARAVHVPARRTLRNPAATARGCGSASGSTRRSAPSSARRCGRGRTGSTSATHGSRRSARDACDSSASAATGCATGRSTNRKQRPLRFARASSSRSRPRLRAQELPEPVVCRKEPVEVRQLLLPADDGGARLLGEFIGERDLPTIPLLVTRGRRSELWGDPVYPP